MILLVYMLTNIRSDSSMYPEDLATQSVRLKQEQLRREEEKLREIELKVQREINEKRQELLARESQLRAIKARMQREHSNSETDMTNEVEPSSNKPRSGGSAAGADAGADVVFGLDVPLPRKTLELPRKWI